MAATCSPLQLGCSEPVVEVAEDRRPVWPRGFTGSISHCRTLCGAIAARTDRHQSLGLDLDTRDDLDSDLVEQICRPSELREAEHARLGGAVRVHRPKLLFVIKEAVFKAYHPLTGYFLDFLEVTVTLHPRTGSFMARIDDRCPPLEHGRILTGRCGTMADHLVVVVAGSRPG